MTRLVVRTLAARVAPDLGAVTASGKLAQIIGALLTISLVVAIATLITCAITWAIAQSTGAWHTAGRARTGVLVSLAGAALTGSAMAWTNWLLHIGAAL
jgi:hypothetical protein